MYRALLLGSAFGLAGLARAEDEWIELKTPHFTIWSEASEKRTHDWAVEFELFRRGMNQLIPVDEDHTFPAQIILFRSDRRIRPYLRLEHGQPTKASAYTTREYGQTLIALSLEGSRDDVRDLVYATALHWQLSAAERRLPDWLEIGLAEVFTTFVLHGDSCEIGANRDYMYRYVRVAGSLPFDRLVSLKSVDLGFSGSDRDYTAHVTAQCWVMAQALLFTSDGIGWDAFRKYVQAPPTGESPSTELDHRFGLNAASLDRRLAAYLDHGKSERISATFDRTNIDAGFVSRQMAPWEKDLVLGSLLTIGDRLDDADGYLSRAFLAADNDARVREALAIQHLARKELADAGREAQKAIDLGRATYFNHYIVARAALEDLVGTRFNAAVPPNAVEHLVECLRLNPHFIPAYEFLGEIAGVMGTKETKAEDLLLSAGARYGGVFQIQIGCAIVAARRGDEEAAKRFLASAKAVAGDPNSDDGKYYASVEPYVAQQISPLNSGLALLRDTPVGLVTSDSLRTASPDRLRQIVAVVDPMIASEPHANLYYVRATLKVRLNDIDGALADYDRAIALNAKSAEIYTDRGITRRLKGDNDGAVDDYDRAIALNPKYAPAYANRSVVRAAKGDQKGALDDVHRVMAIRMGSS